MSNVATNSVDEVARKRRIRRNVLLLSLMAVGFYATFIALSILKAQH
jgi:hypothetical protein